MTDAPQCYCPRCGQQTAHDTRADDAGVVVAIVCEECGHEFTIAKPDEEMETEQTAINENVSSF